MTSVVGEVQEIISASYKVWKKFEEAKGRVHDAWDIIDKSQSRFEIYQPLVKTNLDEKKSPGSYARFTKMMKNFKVNVENLIELLKKYSAGLPGDKAWFMVVHLSELDHVVSTLNRCLEEFVTFVDDMKKFKESNASKQSAEEDAKAKEKEASVAAKRRREEEKKRKREQNLVMKLMLAKDRAELVKAATDEKSEEWEKMERSLVDMDELITRADARRILGPLREEIKKAARDEAKKEDVPAKADPKGPKKKFGQNSLAPPKASQSGSRSPSPGKDASPAPDKLVGQNILPLPKASPANDRSPSPAKKTPKKSFGQKSVTPLIETPPKSPSPANNTPSVPKKYSISVREPPPPPPPASTLPSPAPGAPKMTHAYRIVFVDFGNGARSTLAQCYLEHLRLWTANATGHWLCNRIESAGAGVQSTFLSSAISANFINDVMDTVDVKGQPLDAGAIEVFNRSIAAVGGHCRETRALVERMKTLKRRAVDERILLGARHIVCFGDFTPKLLLKLKAYAMNQSPAGISKDVSGNENGQVTLLKSDFLEMNASDAQLEKALANVKEQVNEFVARELNWTQPGVKIWQGMYRTRQFCVPWDKREAVQAKQEEIRKKYDCKHIKTYYAAPELGMLVTVIGPKDVEKLDKVEEDLKALL